MADSGGNSVQVSQSYDWTEVPPSVAIIETIAEYEDETLDWTVENQNLPLAHCLDADALDTLVGNGTDLSLSFSYAEYDILIHGNEVAVAPAAGSG